MDIGYNAARILYLPFELWGSVCQWLKKDDIRSTRLACRLFNEVASPFLLQRVWISSSSEDQKTLTAISLHQVFSKYVKEIYYDSTIYDPDLLTIFNDDRSYGKYIRRFLKNRSRTIWPKNALRYAISQYKVRCKEQIELQAYEGAHLTRSSDAPPNFGSLLTAAKGSEEVPHRLDVDTFDRFWYRGFYVLTQAASMLNLKQLRSFVTDSAKQGISYTVLDMASTELMHTCNAFRHLATISLQIDTQNGNSQWNWIKFLGGGNVALMLTAAQGLKHLDLGFDMPYTEIRKLAKLLGHLAWPCLQHVGLSNMILEEDELVAFLKRHISTLESISLDYMILFKHHPQDRIFGDWTPKSWKGAFRSMSVLALNNLCISIPLSDGEPCSMRGYWHGDDPAKVNRFLASGGYTGFAENELQYDQEQQRQWLQAQWEYENLDRE
ncbi:hypothetical protein HO133_007045 [Letharia lupina]|uniref:F-box domain-containing protein n=1 Tax=Letharia lupina TaxID=560253 RepID=A0A8H6FI39_9LECA|nr:uncharacterized protein HO133_007045 [Letharia lupina]KAF6228933.1 hypothetical protein HO133_007045 [Letharia lupina]